MGLLDQGVWARWPLEVCFNLHHSVILWPLISHASNFISAFMLSYAGSKNRQRDCCRIICTVISKFILFFEILTVYTWEKLCFNIGNVSKRWSLIHNLILSVEFSLAFCSSWTVNIACIFTLLFSTVPTSYILI